MKQIAALAAAAALALIAQPAAAGHDDDSSDDDSGGSSICERSANDMFRSCRFEVEEELFSSVAKCRNFGDRDERRTCKEVARETRREDRRGCRDQREARDDVCELLGENRYDPEALLDNDNFVDDPVGNAYFSLVPGHTYVARAGEDFEETIVVTVTDETREILGVPCRIVVDIVLIEDEDGGWEVIEVTDDYYAQAVNGDVQYCGEVARNFEDGALVDLDGSFEAGRDYAKSGILIKAVPSTGDAHRQEYLLGEAEDVIRYVAGAEATTNVGPDEGGDNPNFPCVGSCVKTEEFIPPEPDSGEYKYFIAGTGFVLGVDLEDGEPTGERDEMLCMGPGLDILTDDPSCGINGDPELLDLLCELSPIAFCMD